MMPNLRILMLPALLAGLCAAGPVRGQSLQLTARMEHGAFVQHEPLTLTLTLTNHGGSPYIVDDYGDHQRNTLRILLKSAEDGFLNQQVDMPFGPLMIMPGETETLRVNLLRVFPIVRQGRYFAQVIARRSDETVASRQQMFDIVRGIEIGSITRPVPDYDTMFRKYTLLYWPRNQVEVLFLRVDETPPGRSIGLVQLGNLVRFTDPRIEFERDGTLTVVHQSSRDLLIRTVIRTDRNRLEVVERTRMLEPNIPRGLGGTPDGGSRSEGAGLIQRDRRQR